MYTTEFSIGEVMITANFTVYGSYRPATRIDPEEFPEVEISALFDEMGNKLAWDGDFWVQGEYLNGGDVRDYDLATESEAWAKAEEICQEWLDEIEDCDYDDYC